MLNEEIIREAFASLNKKLAAKNKIGEVGIVGGAAMLLAYHARAATKDVDAIFAPATEIREAAADVAKDLNLPEDWINDSVKGFLPDGVLPTKNTILRLSNLFVWTPEPEYMLAMKAISARIDSKDKEDLKYLITRCGLTTPLAVFESIQKYYPRGLISVKTQYFVEELFE